MTTRQKEKEEEEEEESVAVSRSACTVLSCLDVGPSGRTMSRSGHRQSKRMLPRLDLMTTFFSLSEQLGLTMDDNR